MPLRIKLKSTGEDSMKKAHRSDDGLLFIMDVTMDHLWALAISNALVAV